MKRETESALHKLASESEEEKQLGFISKLKSYIIRKFHHYVLFRKPVFFISGLIFGHGLVKTAVLSILILYITETWGHSNLPKAAILLNAQEGLSSILVVFEANLADSHLGRFNLVIFSSISMIGGLTLLRVLDPAGDLELFVGAAILIALGEAGKEGVLKAFLADQLKDEKKHNEQFIKNEITIGQSMKSVTSQANAEVISAEELEKEGTTSKLTEEKILEGSVNEDITSTKLCEAKLLEVGVNKDGTTGKSPEQMILDDRVNTWWQFFQMLGTVAGAFGARKLKPLGSTWRRTFFTTGIVMASSLVFFLLGFPFYKYAEPKGSPIETLFTVLNRAFRNRKAKYSDNPDDYKENESHKVPLGPNVPLSRWVDKAALIVATSSPSNGKKGERNNIMEQCTVKEVKEVKMLMRMVPMWATFVVYCVTQATGSTFFFEQTSDMIMTVNIGKNEYTVPPMSFYMMQLLLSLSIKLLANYIISFSWFQDNERRKMIAYKVRIGLGLACSCLACVAAMFVEQVRLRRYHKHMPADNRIEKMNMHVFYLTPQFCLLGLMEGLTEDGLVDFFYYQVGESSKCYGPLFNQFAMGLGKFFSIFWILTFRPWLGDSIDTSRFDKYYMVLALVNFGNLFVVYTFVSIFVYKDTEGAPLSCGGFLESCFGRRGTAPQGPEMSKPCSTNNEDGSGCKNGPPNSELKDSCCFHLCPHD